MGKAWIDGAAAPFADAVAMAARHLSASRQPLVTGRLADVAEVRAAAALAGASGGVLDHEGSPALYRTLEVMRRAGLVRGVPAELRRRCDRILVVGADAADIAPGVLAHLLSGPVDLGRGAGARRSVLWLGAPAGGTLPGGEADVATLPLAAEDICGFVGVMRASLGGRRFDAGAEGTAEAAETAAWLAGAAFAAVAWSAGTIDAVTVEMLAGLAADLNAGTRASAIPLGAGDGAAGAAEVAAWTTGYPLRVGFAGAEAEHDPFRFDGARLLASGECDLVVRVLAPGAEPLAAPAGGAVPLIALLGADAAGGEAAAVAFRTGVAGRDHAGALWDERIASFVPFKPEGAAEPDGAASGDPSAAEVLRAIAEALRGLADAGETARC